MPKLSTSTTQPTPGAAQDAVHIPYVVHIRIVPDLAHGKRMELFRDLEKKALRVEENLVTAGLNIATPVAFTPQFGDFTARLTIVGFDEKSATDDGDNEAPTSDIEVIHSQGNGVLVDEPTDVVVVNRGGSLSAGQDPTATVSARVQALITAILGAADASTPGRSIALFEAKDIVYVEYNGVKFGMKKQGLRSFQ